MTLRVVFRRAAKNEFEDAAVWYDERRPGLGEEYNPGSGADGLEPALLH